MKTYAPLCLGLLLIIGCGEPEKKADENVAKAGVVIERIGEQIVGVRPAHGDVEVVDEVPLTEQEYRDKYGKPPRQFLFSQRDMRFYGYRLGRKVELKSEGGHPAEGF